MPRGGNRAVAHNRILEEPAMAKAKTLVGLDVHAAKIVAAVLDADTGEIAFFAMTAEIEQAAGFCAALPRPVRVAYEAGPTGYGLARELIKRRVDCVVAAPSKIPRASGDRVKTDRRDAELLVRLLLAGKLHAVRVPGAQEEALRDLVRAREGVRVDLVRCRHRLSKLLLRHGIRFEDGDAWTDRHRAWLNGIVLEWPAAQATLLDVQGAIDALPHRRDGLERQIVAMLASSPWTTQVGVLRCLRGVDTLSRVVRRGRRLHPVRQGGAVDELRRARPVREHHRTTAAARVDHEGRVRARPAAACRGSMALPPATEPQQTPDRTPGRPAPGSCRGLLDGAKAPAPHLGAP
jgi:transposase